MATGDTMQLVHQALRENSLFARLDAADLERVVQMASVRELAEGEALFHEGDLVEHTHVVADGLLRVYQVGPKGSRQLVLHMAGPPESIGEIAVLSERQHYPVTAEAALPSRVVRVPREGILQLMEERPRFTRALLRSVAERQFELLLLLRRVAFFEVQSRLAQYLLEQHATLGPGFPLPTNPELAALLGTVPEIVSRTLSRFYKQGWIRLEDRRVWLENEVTLIAVAKG
ncbi:Crp/Fnr family transcriptional regulator [Oceanithermus profundus]|uniref:Transcriptional regulator, Crp/Fnr family n=1 Tax=Oceanithermus profundus (strain DSM 14977 / NBRC 100410 / VKM B-2274 / 506) TaxID=670487 RepID=E4U5A8_OCEP5|nr:Crp/Fnr family transcriptional regulator [Oceanithermus profundus]ADR37582.1 transcriptional regulator, Crp/Fnr family [Oceanithermus profundus DSM 14977]